MEDGDKSFSEAEMRGVEYCIVHWRLHISSGLRLSVLDNNHNRVFSHGDPTRQLNILEILRGKLLP